MNRRMPKYRGIIRIIRFLFQIFKWRPNLFAHIVGNLPSNYSAVPMVRKDATNIFEHTRHRATRNRLSYEWDIYRSLNQTRLNIGDFS